MDTIKRTATIMAVVAAVVVAVWLVFLSARVLTSLVYIWALGAVAALALRIFAEWAGPNTEHDSWPSRLWFAAVWPLSLWNVLKAHK